MVEDIVLKIMA